MSRIRMEVMELLCVAVNNLDAAVQRYADLFGLEFRVFTPGVDYAVAVDPDAPGDSGKPQSSYARIAVDTSGCFELIEAPDAPEGLRSIHFRVEDMTAAIAQLTGQGLPVLRDMQAGLVHEVVFNPDNLNGVRLCLVQYPGSSFAEALTASPRP
jgi:catechol 2,3-dioxygenase-like lactoylglutathione lyase family enzyme